MDETGSRDLKLWFADGTNYPGQDDIRARQDRLAESLADDLRPARRATSGCVLEYKFFEPAFYTRTCRTGAPSYAHCVAARRARRMVCVDTGHHAPGTNIEFIVAFLLRLGSSARSTSTPGSTPTTT